MVTEEWTHQIWTQAAGQMFTHLRCWRSAAGAHNHFANVHTPGKRTKCSRLDAPGCLLIGDAAHSVTPVFGQVRLEFTYAFACLLVCSQRVSDLGLGAQHSSG